MELHLKDVLLNNDYHKVELEFRIGEMAGDRFVSSLRKVAWNQMKSKMKEVPVEYTVIDKYVASKDQGISTRFVSKSNGEEFWEQKKKIGNSTAPKGRFAMRSSVALEEQTTSPPQGVPRAKTGAQFALQRKKVRSSYTMGCWRVDFSRVEQIPDRGDVEETYEVEVELADNGIFFEKEVEQVLREGEKIVEMLVQGIAY